MTDIFDLLVVSSFTGMGVAVGQSIFKLWIEPHIESLHKRIAAEEKEVKS
jgi:hypothetical protein